MGADIICAQGYILKTLDLDLHITCNSEEGGGHTSAIPTSLLIPAVVDACKGKFSKLTGEPISVVAAGGIYDGRGLAMALAMGAQGVYLICLDEARVTIFMF